MRVEFEGKRNALIVVLVALLGSVALWPVEGQAEAPQAWVLLCSDAATWTDVRRKEAARLFLGRADTVAGQRAEPINVEPLEQRLAFLSALTHLPPTLVERHFLEMKFRGEGDWPRAVEGPTELVALLRKNPSRIGWLSVQDFEALEDRVREGIRPLTLDGRDRQSGDYALKAR